MSTGQSPDRSGGGFDWGGALAGAGGLVWQRPRLSPGRVGRGLSPQLIQPLIIPLPIHDVGVVLASPLPHAFVHHALPQRRHHGEGGHHRVAVGELGGGVLGMALQQGKAAVGFVVVVGMALQVDQQPVGGFVCGVPAMPWQDVFVFARTKVAAGQAVMLHIVDQFQLPDGDEGLQGEQGHALRAAEDASQRKHADLQGGVAPERV